MSRRVKLLLLSAVVVLGLLPFFWNLEPPSRLVEEPSAEPPAGEELGYTFPPVPPPRGKRWLECEMPGSGRFRSKTIDVEGDSIELGPHRITIPAGGLAGPTEVTLREPRSAIVTLIVTISPVAELREPAELEISYERCSGGAPGEPEVYRVAAGTPATLPEAQEHDSSRRRVIAQLRRFSNFALATN